MVLGLFSLFHKKRITKKCQRNLAKFKSTDFDYAKFVRKFYIENGDAHISAEVDSMDDVVNKYSVRGYEWLNKDFADYIEECAYYVPIEYAIILEIEGCAFTQEEQSVIRRVIDDYFGLQLGYRMVDVRQNNKIVLALLAAGLTCMSLFVLFSNVINVDLGPLNEVILVISWFLIWESASRWLLRRRELLDAKVEAGQLYEMKICFMDSRAVPAGESAVCGERRCAEQPEDTLEDDMAGNSVNAGN